MQNAVCTLSTQLKPAQKGVSFPGVLFIISSSFLASCYYIRVSNHNVSIDFFWTEAHVTDAFYEALSDAYFSIRQGGGERGHLSDRWGMLLPVGVGVMFTSLAVVSGPREADEVGYAWFLW